MFHFPSFSCSKVIFKYSSGSCSGNKSAHSINVTFEQYTDLVNAANAIVNDTDARYEAFAKAEAYMLENVLVSPTYYDIAWSLTHANEYSKINAMYGGCNYKAVNWETSEEAYTTVQYEQFAKAFDQASQG